MLSYAGDAPAWPAFGGEPFDLLAERRRAVVRERRGPARATADDLLQAATFADRALLKALARRDTSRERRQLRALATARRRRRGNHGVPGARGSAGASR